jgi:vitamin B12 transporter
VITRDALFVAATLLATTVGGAQARRDSVAPLLPSISVTATRTDLVATAQAISTTTFDRAALRSAGVTQVADIVRLMPGTSVLAGGSFGAQTALFMRGGESDYAQVLVDGVPINAPGGFFDFGQLTLDNVDRVEIVRGPASLLYGSDAVSGVIQIFTRRGEATTRASATLGSGNYGARRYEGNASGTLQSVRWSLGAARHATDGILAFNNAFTNDAVSATAAWDGARFSVSSALRYTDHEYRYPTDGGGVLADSNALATTTRVVASADVGYRVRPNLTVRARTTHNVAEPRLRDLADGPADTVGFFGFRSDAEVTRRLVELRAEAIVAPGHVLTVAAERATDREVNSSVSFSSFGDFPGALDAERTNDAVVAQLVGNVGLRSTYIVGVRRDENSAFGSFTTARAAGAVRVTPSTSLRGSIGTAFKAPTFFENFATGFTLGNPALAPERTQSVELGLVQDLTDGRGSIGVTAFTQRFRDVIQYTATVPSGAPNFANLATARADGVELEGRWRVVGAVQVHGSYTYLDTEVTDAGANEGPSATFVNGDRLLRRPTNLAVLGTRWARGRASVDLSATYTGERDDRDFTAFPATPVSQPAFTRVDLALAWPLPQVARGIPLTGVARAENLFNAYYEPTLGFRAPGRSIFVGVRIGD